MTRVVVAGLGDTGVLTAARLARLRPGWEVTGINPRPGLVSGQELGLRVARPGAWARDYLVAHDDLRALDGVETVQATVREVDLARHRLIVHGLGGRRETLEWDVLVIATGVGNGFWRRPALEGLDEARGGIERVHRRIAAAESVAVVGGGAAAVGAAGQLAAVRGGVHLVHPGERALTRHHPRVWQTVRARLLRLGVTLHPDRRALITDDDLQPGPVRFSTGQPDLAVDLVLPALGRVRPHTDWLPDQLLDDGFVRTGLDLRVTGGDDVFAIGDVAATDPLRSSARNFAHRTLARNVVAHVEGRPLASWRPPRHRWGSVLGPLPQGYDIFGPSGRRFWLPAVAVDQVLQPLVVRRGIYGGVRR